MEMVKGWGMEKVKGLGLEMGWERVRGLVMVKVRDLEREILMD